MLAVLYDIHANLPALDAVLADAEAAGAERYFLGGDYAALGAWPVETVERLRSLSGANWIRGNWERWLKNPSDPPDIPFIQDAAAWARTVLGADTIDELSRLTPTATIDDTLFSHASPISDMRSFMPEPAEDEAELIDGAAERRLVFGHTHVQFRRQGEGGVELVNPGSVGLPFDGDTRAAYALVSDDGELELRRVAYDHEGAATAIRERMEGFGDDLAARIETASPPS
ncbi:MAG TPA: metallophosphoesterase family protein [Thermoleophilaceae bacterium]|jgi:diadenosine tetraphosphatase ApaH/serine/threonine PP2A family protein phosphatase